MGKKIRKEGKEDNRKWKKGRGGWRNVRNYGEKENKDERSNGFEGNEWKWRRRKDDKIGRNREKIEG